MDTIILLLLVAATLINIAITGLLAFKFLGLRILYKNLNTKGLQEISKEVAELKTASENSIQKIGLVKFNPFKDMGGKLSFALVLLNKKNMGVVISGLHSRDATRLYVKDVSCGRNEKNELSLEEKEALEKAVKNYGNAK